MPSQHHDSDADPTPRSDIDGTGVGGLDLIAGWVFAIVAGIIIVGLTMMTVVGQFSPIAVAIAGGAVGTGVTLPLFRWTRRRGRWVTSPADIVLVVLVSVWILMNASFAGQHVFPDRDPGVYVTTAWWMSAARVPLVPLAPDVVDESDGTFAMSGFYDDRGTGVLSAQFLHGLPVVLAVAKAIGGVGGLYLAPVVLGGLALVAVYLFTTRLLPRWWSLLAVVSLAGNLVHVYFSRDAYTEPLTMLLVFGAFWLLLAAPDRLGVTALGAFLLGAALCVRIDAWILVAAVPVFVLHVALRQRSGEIIGTARFALVAVGVPVFLGAIGVSDLIRFSPSYWEDQTRRLTQVGMLIAGVATACWIAFRWRSVLGAALRGRQGVIADSLAVVLGAIGLFLGVVRPLTLQVRSGTTPLVAELLRIEGFEADATRTMAEMSGRWMWWYLGPLAIVGGLGLISLARRMVLKPDPRLTLFGSSVLVFSVVYLWKPTITPDQIWAMRRFLPVVIPGITVAAVWWLHLIVSVGSRRFAARIAAVAAIPIAMAPLYRLIPVIDVSKMQGAQDLVVSICDDLPDSALLMADDAGQSRIWGATLRMMCDVPTVVAPFEKLTSIDDEARSAGYEPLWFGVGCHVGGDVLISTGAPFPALERTIMRPPKAMVNEYYGVEIRRIPDFTPSSCVKAG